MGTGYGQKSILGIAFQNSFGTAADVGSLHYIPHVSESIGLEIPPLIGEHAEGIHDENQTEEGAKSTPGDLEMQAMSLPLGVLLKAAVGDPTTTVVESGSDVWAHVFKPRVDDFDDYSAQNPVSVYKFLDVDSAQLFQDLNATTLEMGISQGEFLTVNASFVGGKETDVAEQAASLPTGRKFTWDVTSTSLDGAGVSNLTEITMTVDNGLEAQHTLDGTLYPNRIKRQSMRTITVAGTMKFNSMAEYQQFASQSERPLIVNLRGKTEISSGYYDEFKADFPKFRYEEFKPQNGGPGQIEVSFTGKAKYHSGSATAAEFTLQNTQTAY